MSSFGTFATIVDESGNTYEMYLDYDFRDQMDRTESHNTSKVVPVEETHTMKEN